jgi:uncharacterized membrane protein YgcG
MATATNNRRLGLAQVRHLYPGAHDALRLNAKHEHGSRSDHRLERLGIVFVLLFMAAVFAGAAHAGDLVTGDSVVTPTDSAGTTVTPTDSAGTTDGATDSTETSSSDPTAPSDGGDPGSETSTDTATSSDPPADATGSGDTSSPSDGAPLPEPSSGDATSDPGSTTPPVTEEPPVTETPPVVEPVDPPAEEQSPVAAGDEGQQQKPTEPFPSGATGIELDGVIGTAPVVSGGLDLLQIGGGPSTKDRDTRVADGDGRPTKASSATSSFHHQGSPTGSSSSGASGGSGASGSGGGVGLAVEFLLVALVILRYAYRASFTLPDSRAFALREERPG